MRNSDFTAYHESITAELLASRNRVRYFIGNRHWGEDGRFKEVLLMNYLKKVLPSNISIGTGFVSNGQEITSQIDLIIYDNSIPTLFSEGDFVIALPESIYGIIEVKSKLSANEKCSNAIIKANKNGEIIGNNIFNGIFGYESDISFSENRVLPDTVKHALLSNNGYINHITFGPDIFVKYWGEGNPEDIDELECFSFYKLRNLSFGYFISNLIETIHIKSRNQPLSDNLSDFLYPVNEGKETRRLKHLEMKLRVPISRG
ncbi:DUF6602 domain-containing protein [Neobacillus ginsengisoli]|uniref:DUF6602 domain-containing protein n=1 Tax=Neobacillus ginsengisoli TaxID=904295 RepID=A0ABT9Y0F3_9BACI|nr:DUF6602 domain-containing protein [Neobacillus ginsengisoli]MDQ0201076.1 hypothetical protein [Neobacillus ginsengisoli]